MERALFQRKYVRFGFIAAAAMFVVAPSVCDGGFQAVLQEYFLTSPDVDRASIFVDTRSYEGGPIPYSSAADPSIRYDPEDGSLELILPAHVAGVNYPYVQEGSPRERFRGVDPWGWSELTTIALLLPPGNMAPVEAESLRAEFWYYGAASYLHEVRDAPPSHERPQLDQAGHLTWTFTHRDATSRFMTPELLGGRIDLGPLLPPDLSRDDLLAALGAGSRNFFATASYRSPLPNLPVVVESLSIVLVPEPGESTLAVTALLLAARRLGAGRTPVLMGAISPS